MEEILKSYLKRLTNLTANNRSLLLLRLVANQFIDIHDFNFVNNKPSFQIISDLIGRKKKIPLCNTTDSRDEDVNILNRRLKKLLRTDNFLFEERGSKDLYVGWPMVKGKFADGTPVRCPLMFFPVALAQDENRWYLKQREDISISLNKSFLLGYGHYSGIKIADDFLERDFDDFDTDKTVFRTALYQLFKESPVDINFNPDNFADELYKFEEYKKDDFIKSEKNGELKLFPEAVLGIFPQSGSYLVPDYEKLLENDQFKDIEEFFAERTFINEDNSLPTVKEENTFTPLKLDAYQEKALKAAKQGKSLVIQGPPGTGKSQLICNLITDFIARGKRVLLVCQKRAALDVVHQRLDELNLKEFINLVHDFKHDRKSIYENINRQIERLDEYKRQNNGLDTVQLERLFSQYSRQIDQITEDISEFKKALFDESECGMSIKELYLTSSPHKPAANVKQEYNRFNFNEIVSFTNRFRSYATYSSKYRSIDYPLLDRQSFSSLGIAELRRMQELLAEIPQYKKEVEASTKEITGHAITLETSLAVIDKKERIKELLSLLHDPDVYNSFQHLVPYRTQDKDLLWISDLERALLGCFNEEGIEQTVPTYKLGLLQETLQSTINARRNIFKRWKWLFSKDRKSLIKVLNANNLSNNRKGIKILIKKTDKRLNLEHNITLLSETDWVPPFPEMYAKGTLQNWFHTVKLAFKAKLIFTSLRNFKEYFSVKKLSYQELEDKLDKLFRSIEMIPDVWVNWRIYFTQGQLRKLTTDEEWYNRLCKTLDRDFESLCEFDKLQDEMPLFERTVADKVIEIVEPFDLDIAEEVFLNSIKLQWIDHIETKYPILRAVSSTKLRQMEADLQNSVREKLRISNEILLLRLKEKTYEDVEYNRLNNMVTYRDLKHQVTKKRRIWPLRKLIGNYAEELFDLIPCWMASPEAVSAIFPMEKMFDLIIFDEASQCFAESGIPAMYRGKQVIVSGDEKQLRPNDLYQIRWDEETEELALEVDSLLSLASHNLMSVQLKGHYRSKTIDLISFSNKNFYQNNLQLLPDKEMLNKQEPAIKYIKIEGVWEKNKNEIEARKVIELTFDLIKNKPDKEIGIVTFNAKQQELIQDMLDEHAIKMGITLPKSLIVKNIENIQGDEKDIIIFSMAYAPDKSGKLSMQFGSLNQVNGENRLNVAVTRARESIYIITSIWPQQLKVDDLKNAGPKLLKDYLTYAKEVSDGNFMPEPIARVKKQSSWYLKDQLMKWGSDSLSHSGFEMLEELPFADLTIKEGNQYIGLIRTDDDLYYQSPSVKDIHVYLPFTLSKKKWKSKGFFSREFWQKPEEVKEGIVRFLYQNKKEQN